jgi:hypothetical protein
LNEATTQGLPDLVESVRDHLVVDWVVVTPLEGRRIDVGEEFDVQLSVRNSLRQDDVFAFADIEVLIESGEYVELAGASRRAIGRLGPGERAKEVLRFRALAADTPTEQSTKHEPIARIRARARLELASAPSIETSAKLITAQIHGSGSPE